MKSFFAQYRNTKFFLTISATALLAITGCSSSDKDSLSESDLNGGGANSHFGDGSIPLAEGEGMFRDVHFGYDSANVDSSARQDIEYNASVLKGAHAMKIVLEGHCDERGTNDYNMALGASRAKSVERALTALGVPSASLGTISYGEEVPLDPGHNESAWAKNRRVHFSAARGK